MLGHDHCGKGEERGTQKRPLDHRLPVNPGGRVRAQDDANRLNNISLRNHEDNVVVQRLEAMAVLLKCMSTYTMMRVRNAAAHSDVKETAAMVACEWAEIGDRVRDIGPPVGRQERRRVDRHPRAVQRVILMSDQHNGHEQLHRLARCADQEHSQGQPGRDRRTGSNGWLRLAGAGAGVRSPSSALARRRGARHRYGVRRPGHRHLLLLVHVHENAVALITAPDHVQVSRRFRDEIGPGAHSQDDGGHENQHVEGSRIRAVKQAAGDQRKDGPRWPACAPDRHVETTVARRQQLCNQWRQHTNDAARNKAEDKACNQRLRKGVRHLQQRAAEYGGEQGWPDNGHAAVPVRNPSGEQDRHEVSHH
mmetsp:Transcript_51600/g.144038  ORF Transcript_51600/g.144038 Transcript_51600/m.144038 type:complete len:364 (+) Transcript_51600:551-1642(+)